MEDDDEEDVTEVETNSDPFWMKTCVICSLTLCVCLTPAEVEAESEAAASILEALNNHYDTEEIVDCPAEEEAESEEAALNNDTDEVVEYIINKLCHDSTKLKLQIEVRDSPSRLPKEMSGLLSSPYVSLTIEKSLRWT